MSQKLLNKTNKTKQKKKKKKKEKMFFLRSDNVFINFGLISPIFRQIFEMLNGDKVVSVGIYVRTCQWVRNGKKMAFYDLFMLLSILG